MIPPEPQKKLLSTTWDPHKAYLQSLYDWLVLLMEEILHPWDVKNIVNNGINYLSTVAQDFFHQQYHMFFSEFIVFCARSLDERVLVI